MGAAPSEYDAVVADLENQILELQSTVEVLKRLRDKGATSQGVTLSPPGEGMAVKAPVVRTSIQRMPVLDVPPAIPSDAFFGMSIVDAAKKYLGLVKKPQGTKVIADALNRGGLQHASKSLYATLFSILSRRALKEGDIAKVGLEWGLVIRSGPK